MPRGREAHGASAGLTPLDDGGLRFGRCQWIEGDALDRDFCGAKVLEGSSYCPRHHAVCYVQDVGKLRSDDVFEAVRASGARGATLVDLARTMGSRVERLRAICLPLWRAGVLGRRMAAARGQGFVYFVPGVES